MAEGSSQGGCLCGGVRFELTAPPVLAGYCHCTRQFVAYAAPWEPIPNDGLDRFPESRHRDDLKP